jgi:hypothetical protein
MILVYRLEYSSWNDIETTIDQEQRDAEEIVQQTNSDHRTGQAQCQHSGG